VLQRSQAPTAHTQQQPMKGEGGGEGHVWPQPSWHCENSEITALYISETALGRFSRLEMISVCMAQTVGPTVLHVTAMYRYIIAHSTHA
jgi:hypothetical protein